MFAHSTGPAGDQITKWRDGHTYIYRGQSLTSTEKARCTRPNKVVNFAAIEVVQPNIEFR